jgi:hypothetical protein
LATKGLKTFRFRNKKTRGCRRVKAKSRKEAWKVLGELVADDLSYGRAGRRFASGRYIRSSTGVRAAKSRYTPVKTCSKPRR